MTNQTTIPAEVQAALDAQRVLGLADLTFSCGERYVFIDVDKNILIKLPADEARVLATFIMEAIGE